MTRYTAQTFNRARKTWLGTTIGGKGYLDAETDQEALAVFFKDITNKAGEYRLQEHITFGDGTYKNKTVCELRKR